MEAFRAKRGVSVGLRLASVGLVAGCGMEVFRAAMGTPAGSKSLYFEDFLMAAARMLEAWGDISLLWT